MLNSKKIEKFKAALEEEINALLQSKAAELQALIESELPKGFGCVSEDTIVQLQNADGEAIDDSESATQKQIEFQDALANVLWIQNYELHIPHPSEFKK